MEAAPGGPLVVLAEGWGFPWSGFHVLAGLPWVQTGVVVEGAGQGRFPVVLVGQVPVQGGGQLAYFLTSTVAWPWEHTDFLESLELGQDGVHSTVVEAGGWTTPPA